MIPASQNSRNNSSSFHLESDRHLSNKEICRFKDSSKARSGTSKLIDTESGTFTHIEATFKFLFASVCAIRPYLSGDFRKKKAEQ